MWRAGPVRRSRRLSRRRRCRLRRRTARRRGSRGRRVGRADGSELAAGDGEAEGVDAFEAVVGDDSVAAFEFRLVEQVHGGAEQWVSGYFDGVAEHGVHGDADGPAVAAGERRGLEGDDAVEVGFACVGVDVAGDAAGFVVGVGVGGQPCLEPAAEPDLDHGATAARLRRANAMVWPMAASRGTVAPSSVASAATAARVSSCMVQRASGNGESSIWS